MVRREPVTQQAQHSSRTVPIRGGRELWRTRQASPSHAAFGIPFEVDGGEALFFVLTPCLASATRDRRRKGLRRDVTFLSKGLKCSGWLYLPDDLAPEKRAPAIIMSHVIMGHGFSGTKDVYLSKYAEPFAALPAAISWRRQRRPRSLSACRAGQAGCLSAEPRREDAP